MSGQQQRINQEEEITIDFKKELPFILPEIQLIMTIKNKGFMYFVEIFFGAFRDVGHLITKVINRNNNGGSYNAGPTAAPKASMDFSPNRPTFKINQKELNSALTELHSIVGLAPVKSYFQELQDTVSLQSERHAAGQSKRKQTMHMVFTGNPGTGKTSLAQIAAKMFKALGVVTKGHFIQVTREDLVGEYIGHTAPKTREVINRAVGGILFIDEAYTLSRGGEKDFGKEAIDTLVKFMEEYRDNLIVILAGYTKEMDEFMKANSGLKSRFPNIIEFPDYTPEELFEIAENQLDADNFILEGDAGDALYSALERRQIPGRNEDGNGRLVRNVIEEAVRKQSSRLTNSGRRSSEDLRTITAEDFGYVEGEIFNLEAELSKIVGNEDVKTMLRSLSAQLQVQRARKENGITSVNGQSLHMVFKGNPGTGKTTIARILGKMLKEMGVLKSGLMIEKDKSGLVAPYVGQTADKVLDVVKQALGGILFIDEAYSLANGDQFGKEAIDTLVKAMEDHRENLIIVLAGYNEDMEKFFDVNAGLRSRFPNVFEFQDYTVDEMFRIMEMMLDQAKYQLSLEAIPTVKAALLKAEGNREAGNGRYVRNLMESAIRNMAIRLHEQSVSEEMDLITLTAADFGGAVENETFDLETELASIVGNEEVKEHIRALAAQVKVQKMKQEKGIAQSTIQTLHMVFKGNPGTGKTTIARIIGKMLKHMGILKSGQLIETDRSGLVASFVGQTAPKTHKVIDKALGGILFIDEAYALASGGENDFGREAIDALVKGMEDHRGNLIVILAGYNEDMEHFFQMNAGLKSRFPLIFEFKDYSVDEMLQIFELMANGLNVDPGCAEVIRPILGNAEGVREAGNGRFVRNLLEGAMRNQAVRLQNLPDPTQHDLITLLPDDFRGVK
ncbi:AAA family ATPase [Paenibacillus luteus]|uniref:AAA family ATPase n=1 Tax=Paenibacillus luteus TaxID=2545753 RepID=UPI00114394DE|nr:AAA family ATPase [Paenibacillus luteus]